MKPQVTEKQARILKKLADAYYDLGEVWDDTWEGPENFGGVMDRAGILPRISLDEASAEAQWLFESSMLLLTGLDVIRDTFKGSTEYTKSDEKYHYYLTTHEGTGEHMHRISNETYVYQFRYATDLNPWDEDEVVTRAIQAAHTELFKRKGVEANGSSYGVAETTGEGIEGTGEDTAFMAPDGTGQ